MTTVVGLLVVLLLAGCAAQMQRTEEGYAPEYFTIGKINVSFDGRMDRAQLKDMIRQHLQRAMDEQDLQLVDDQEAATLPPASVGVMEISVNFQQDARAMTTSQDARINFVVQRKSDSLVWLDGSASSTDKTTSRAMGVDVVNAVRLATESMAEKLAARL
jgi:hypothetical protein